jgi:hypothetical protein
MLIGYEPSYVCVIIAKDLSKGLGALPKLSPN